MANALAQLAGGMSDQDYANALIRARQQQIPEAFRTAQEPGLEAPMLSPEDLIGSGAITKGALLAKALAAKAGGGNALAALAGTFIGKNAKTWNSLAAEKASEMEAAGHALSMMAQPKTEFELAHELAQRNAALPVEQGGLGLPADNTAMDRAKAMGFDTPAYHGTNYDIGDIDQFRHGYIGENFKESAGGFHFAGDEDTARLYGENILEARIKNPSNVIDLESGHPNFETYMHSPASFYDWNNSDLADMVDNGGLAITKGDEVQYILNEPSHIRSRFAAFDPMQRNSANILAGGAAGALGLNALFNMAQDQQYY